MHDNFNQTTQSLQRAKHLQDQSQNIAKAFHINNFYQNNYLNIGKLKEKILQAKRRLLLSRTQKEKLLNKQGSPKKIQKSDIKRRNISVLQTQEEINQYKKLAFNYQDKKKKIKERSLQHRSESRSVYKGRVEKPQKTEKIPRLATDLGEYQFVKKNSIHNLSRVDVDQIVLRGRPKINQFSKNVFEGTTHNGISETPINYSRSIVSMQIEHKKIVIEEKQQFKEYELKIAVLWQLYQLIVQLMQQLSKSESINEKLIKKYIQQVNSQKYQFVHEIYDMFGDIRIERSIKLSRILQNFSVFEMCLNSIPKKKSGPSQIINYLGYSSSSIIFLIKILLLTYQSSFQFAENISTIINSIITFEINSYKMELKNIKEVLRRLEHNNQIIGMIKTRCGRKHGKYCQEFISKLIKSIQKLRIPFYECANNIFEFLSFYVHHEEIAVFLPLLSTPPSPFLSLTYSKTIIIDPWWVLANRKNNKLVIRAHTGKFLAQISDSCNLVFWTQFMPKDANVLVNLFPVKDNIYWLYRYHCRQEKQVLVKMIDLVGCLPQNTIIIDSTSEHFIYNPDIGITMMWKGEKKDTKLLNLSEILQYIFSESQKNKTNLKEELNKVRPEIEQLNPVKKVFTSKKFKYKM